MKLLLVSGALAAAFSVSAQTRGAEIHVMIGNGFYSQCSGSLTSFMQGYCLGVVVGISDQPVPGTAKTLDDFMTSRGFAYCVPGGVTDGQKFEIALNYVKNNPRYRHFGMGNLYTLAMNEAYPCANGSTIEVLPQGALRFVPPSPR